MGTIAEKLAYLQETKEAVKYALIDMGVEVADDEPFYNYPDLIYAIPTSGIPEGVCKITVESSDASLGTVSPGGYVSKNMDVTICATELGDSVFKEWLCYRGNSMMPISIPKPGYSFTVTEDMRFVASFEAQ